MKIRYLILLFLLNPFCCFSAFAQNEIDYVNSLYWSGYGKMAIDDDTLYLNSLNGHGVERYNIADPANPYFLDRENASGFDQIDFERRLMAKFGKGKIALIDFGEFDSTKIVSRILATSPSFHIIDWKLRGANILTVFNDDSMHVYDISNASNPFPVSSFPLVRPDGSLSEYGILYGSSVCIIETEEAFPHRFFIDIYNIADIMNIHFVRADTFYQPTFGGVGIVEARGDTMAEMGCNLMGPWWYLRFISFAPGDSSVLPSWSGYGYEEWPPPSLYNSEYGFILFGDYRGSVAYSFNGFASVGKVEDDLMYSFFFNTEFTPSDYLIYSNTDSLKIYQPTYSDSLLMPLISTVIPSHFGILSSVSYGNYILSGAESNGGELLVNILTEPMSLVAVVPGVGARKTIIDSTFALCLCPNKISQVDITDPYFPQVEYEISGLGNLVDFDKEDSLACAITSNTFYILSYYPSSGFELRATMPFSGAPLTSVVQQGATFYILKGSVGTVLEIVSYYGANPRIDGEYALPHNIYQNMDRYLSQLWVSGTEGTDVVWAINHMSSIGFFGPEYFSDVHDIIFSHDTLFVADGSAGLKVFKSHGNPADSLSFIGGYSTGNVVNQVARVGNSFYLSDYYSLQHLRWGAPTGIETHDNPNLPDKPLLSQNYPNPFNAQTTIRYSLPRSGDVSLEIFDILGRKVATLAEGLQQAGMHEIVWDATAQSSGIYFYKISSGENSKVEKMVLLK